MEKLILEHFLPYQLNRGASAISRDFRKLYGRDHALTVPEWRVLATLGEFGELLAKDICLHSSMHKTKVSRAVSGLEFRRWLLRTQSVDDKREELLSLTPLGRKTYLNIIPRARAFEKAVVEKLGADAAIFQRALACLKDGL